jgi:hypothetical protein
MNRRTLDLLFSAGGVILGALLMILGLVLKDQANFAKDYVKDQLSEQQITFKPADTLVKADVWKADLLKSFEGDQVKVDQFVKDNKLTAEADTPCLVKYAGKQLTTGKMAECYANNFIRLHLKDGSIYAAKLSADPKKQVAQSYTYATIGGVQSELRTQVTDAKTANDPKLADYQAQLDKVNALRNDTLFRGESLRGLLLTSYGFSIFGDRANLAATVCFAAFALMILLSIAGFIHAASAKRRAATEVPPSTPSAPKRDLISA